MIGIDISMPTKCCECQFNDGEDLCYIDGTYAIKDMKIKPSWCPLIDLHMNNKELYDSIERLSELRSGYNCFDEKEQPYYHALSDAIEILQKAAKNKENT